MVQRYPVGNLIENLPLIVRQGITARLPFADINVCVVFGSAFVGVQQIRGPQRIDGCIQMG